MGSKRDDIKEVKWSINYLKSQLDYVRDCKVGTNDGKYPESYEKEGNHEKRHGPDKGNPALTPK